MALPWIQSDGGPLVVVPYARRAGWEGTEPPGGGRVVRATFRWDDAKAKATDYDAAVDAAQQGCGVVRRDGWDALALMRGMKTWRKLRDGVVIVHWESGESPRAVDAMLVAAFPERPRDEQPVTWKRTRRRLRVEGPLVMFDAAYRGRLPVGERFAMAYAKSELKPKRCLRIPLSRGTYAIDEADLEPDAETLMCLYRLRKL